MKFIKTFETITTPFSIKNVVKQFPSAEGFANAVLKGYVTELLFTDIGVSIRNLRIAEENLRQNKHSITPNEPIEIIYNITSNDAFLLDGYHRYLKARGGTIENALKHAKENKGEKILCIIKFEKNYVGKTGVVFPEPLSKEELMELYYKNKK